MIFTAFDFETCNGSGLSAVELGVAVFDDSQLLECRSWRFYPLDDRFVHRNVALNGISKDYVLGLKRFEDLWGQMQPYFNNPMVAHNVSFDARVLCSTLDHLEIPRPESHAYCTFRMAEDSAFDFENYELSTICKELRIPLQHHIAVADATAAGHLLNRMAGGCCLSECLKNSRGDYWLPAWTPATSESGWGSESSFESPSSWSVSGAEVSISLSDILQDSEQGGDNLELDGNGLEQCAQSFRNVVSESDIPELLAGWRVGITGEPLIGKKSMISHLQSVGAAGEPKGTIYLKAKEGVSYRPTNILVIAEEMMAAIAQGRSPTGKMEKFAKLRFGRRPTSVKIISEGNLYELVTDSLNAGTEKLPLDHYVEEDAAVLLLWDQLEGSIA